MICEGKIPMTPDPSCPSCGTPWDKHLGLAGTCADLIAECRHYSELRDLYVHQGIEYQKRIDELEAKVKELVENYKYEDKINSLEAKVVQMEEMVRMLENTVNFYAEKASWEPFVLSGSLIDKDKGYEARCVVAALTALRQGEKG